MDKIKLLLITILFIILSPWFFSFVMFPERFNPNNLTFSTINDQLFIDNINYLQGITRDSSLTFPSRLVVNKYTMYLKKLINNYFETYDPKYLYFEGEDDLTKTPYAAGPLLVGTFSFFAIGIAKSIKKHKYIIYMFMASGIPGAFVVKNYDTISRLLFFLLYAVICSLGFWYLILKHKKIFTVLLLLTLINFAVFYHNFESHYTKAVSKQLYIFK